MPTRRSRTHKIKAQKVQPIVDDELVFYTIYVRRSQEDDEKQKESIPQQLEKCLYLFEKDESINLQLRNTKTFPIDHQTLDEIEEAYGKDKKTAQMIRGFYLKYAIVSERKSAKHPYKRMEWTRLIELVKQGEVRGIFSYSPDRMARNLQEGGEVIQLVDSQLLQIRFTNFVFEDNPSGHMMLGIFFVFAEHYSKKLSEDSTRGQIQASKAGKTDGASKLGYMANTEGCWMQHPINAPILKRAFDRKMYDNWSDKSIAEEMNKQGWEDEKPISGSRISSVDLWQDTFYYGLWERTFRKEGKIIVPLLELEKHPYEPLLTEEEFYTLQETLEKRNKKSLEQRRSSETKILDAATPLGKGIVVDSDTGELLKFSIPSRTQRFMPKLEELQEKMPKATLADVVAPHQIKYARTGNNTNFEVLDKFIYQNIKKVRIGKYEREAFLYQFRLEAEKLHKASKHSKKRIVMLKNKTERDRDTYKNESRFGVGLSEEDKNLYNQKIDTFNAKVKEYEKSLKEVEDNERDEIFEIQAFAEVFLNISDHWKKASYVQKRKISEILLLNIKVKSGKPVFMQVKPELESLFPDLLGNGGAR